MTPSPPTGRTEAADARRWDRSGSADALGGRRITSEPWPGCRRSLLSVTVCASDNRGSGSSGGGRDIKAKPADNRGSGGSAPKCTYEKADPQPPAENLAWDGKTPKDGAIYRVRCEGGRVGVTP